LSIPSFRLLLHGVQGDDRSIAIVHTTYAIVGSIMASMALVLPMPGIAHTTAVLWIAAWSALGIQTMGLVGRPGPVPPLGSWLAWLITVVVIVNLSWVTQTGIIDMIRHAGWALWIVAVVMASLAMMAISTRQLHCHSLGQARISIMPFGRS
jgi:hypothetical protein